MMKKILFILIISFLLMGSQCNIRPINPVDTNRPPVFTNDLELPHECVVLFNSEYMTDTDIQTMVSIIESKNVGYGEKVKVLLEKVTYRWMQHAMLLESYKTTVELCQRSLKKQLDTIYERHEHYCKQYEKIYSIEFDKCMEK